MTAPLQADTDRWLIEAFLRRGLAPPEQAQAFWTLFIQEFTREIHALPGSSIGDPNGYAVAGGRTSPHLQRKLQLAMHWLHAFLANFYEDSAEVFYWQPGDLRQLVYHAALERGVQILPVHPYSPAPDPRHLSARLWSQNSELPGLRIDADRCAALIRELAVEFRAEYEALPFERPAGAPPWSYCLSNGFYDGIDGCILYAMVRHFRPRRIIEVGSGNSTYLSAQAAARNQQATPSHSCEITAIEPYPNPVLRAGFPGLTRLVPHIVQEVPLSLFDELEENDILFIDSSHVVRTGSDVLYEFLEVLPRLRKGVLIHFRDIFLPCEYPKDWVLEMNRYWTEQYLLQAFLACNDSFEVRVPAAYLQVHRPDVLADAFTSFQHGGGWTPSNFWIQKTR